MPCEASAMRARPRLVPSASTAARSAGLSAAGLPVRGDVIFAGQVMAEARRVAAAAR